MLIFPNLHLSISRFTRGPWLSIGSEIEVFSRYSRLELAEVIFVRE